MLLLRISGNSSSNTHISSAYTVVVVLIEDGAICVMELVSGRMICATCAVKLVSEKMAQMTQIILPSVLWMEVVPSKVICAICAPSLRLER